MPSLLSFDENVTADEKAFERGLLDGYPGNR